MAAQPEPLMESTAIAELLGTTPQNLAQMRYRGTGPKFIKLGHRAIRYRWSDVEAWIEANTLTQSDQDFEPKTAA
jgi:predicted DNA-binding transcriptional regulator AlpA